MRFVSITRRFASVTLIAALATHFADVGSTRDVHCATLDLEVWRIEARPTQYAVFCSKEPEACDLSGEPIIDWKTAWPYLEKTNREVNSDITLVPDTIGEGSEECWEFPADGSGDCEDFALEKRRRLTKDGLPSASLTMAIVHHQVQFFPHAVLLVETTRGTWLLDNLFDEIVCWDAAPYRYERRERPDGKWERYVVP